MGRLDDKVAIVTGGGRGLGSVFSHAMVKEGAKIVIADILDKEAEATAHEIRDQGGAALALKVDVTSRSDTRARKFNSSSAMPSAKYSCSGSALRLLNGRTAIAGLSLRSELPTDPRSRPDPELVGRHR